MTAMTSAIVFEVRAVGVGADPAILATQRDAERRADQLAETYGLRRQQITITRKAV